MATKKLYKNPNQERYPEGYVESAIHNFRRVSIDKKMNIEPTKRYKPEFFMFILKRRKVAYTAALFSAYSTPRQ